MNARHGDLVPLSPNTLLYTVIVPAYNESQNVKQVVDGLATELRKDDIPFEILIVNDNSTDDTVEVVEGLRTEYPEIRLVHNTPPGGLGRALRFGFAHAEGEVIAIVMADSSDSPEDVVR